MKSARGSMLLAVSIAFAACNDTTGPATGSQLTLSFASGSSAAPAQAATFGAASDFTITDGQNELVISKAEVVLREIELKRVEIGDCDDDLDIDRCEEFATGPVLLDLPLDGGIDHAFAITVEPGTYDELEFEIHKVGDDSPAEEAFHQAHLDLVGTSIRVRGTYNGQPFSYETDLNEEQEFDLIPPLVIDELTTSANVTVLLDLPEWFRDASGTLVDPSTANKGGPNENLVRNTIRSSIEAFGDDDRDGDRD